jgi:putative transposase
MSLRRERVAGPAAMVEGSSGEGAAPAGIPERVGRRAAGVGRKPGPKTAHRIRSAHRGWQPVHVTLRAGFRVLRSERIFGALQRAFRRSLQRAPEQFRVLQFSIQRDHVHLIVEAANKQALSRGMQGLSISVARRVNRLLGRHGRFWVDRFHARALENPRSVRNALVYVLANFRKHAARRYPDGIDRFSSAPCSTAGCSRRVSAWPSIASPHRSWIPHR